LAFRKNLIVFFEISDAIKFLDLSTLICFQKASMKVEVFKKNIWKHLGKVDISKKFDCIAEKENLSVEIRNLEREKN